MSDPLNPYQHFLGIEVDPRRPDFGKVFGINKKTSADEIDRLASAVIADLMTAKPEKETKRWQDLVKQLENAKAKLIRRAENIAKADQSPSPPSSVAAYQPPAQSPPAQSPPAQSPAAEKASSQSQLPAPSKGLPKNQNTDASQPSHDKKNATVKQHQQASPIEDPPTPSETVGLPQPASGKPKTSVGPRKRAGTEADDQLSFSLDAPDESDSFDSDTNISGQSFSTSPVMATTVDPMAAVIDPTLCWEKFDLKQVPAPVSLFASRETTQMTASPTHLATPFLPPPALTAIDTPQPGVQSISLPSAGTEISATNPSDQNEDRPALSDRKTFYTETYRAKSKTSTMIGGTILAMIIVGAVSYVAIFGGGGSDKPADSDLAQGQTTDETKDKNDAKKEQGNQKPPPADPEIKRIGNTDQPKDPTSKKNGVGMVDNKNNTPDSKKENPANEKPEPTEPKETDAKKTDPKKTDTPETAPKTTDPPVKKEPDPVKPKNSDVAALGNYLQQARQKLLERNFVEANRLIENAGKLPVLPEHQILLDRLVSVSDYYKQFWNNVVEGCGKLKALDEVKFSDTNIVKIVESSEEKIIYRAGGQRFEKAPRELQIGLAMKIAEKEMDPDAADTRIIRGAVFAIQAVEDPVRGEKAQELWEEAKLIGGDTDNLILFLSDQYDLISSFITKSKLPNEEEATAAEEEFKNQYDAQMKLASRNTKAAGTFAQTLLTKVAGIDDAGDRHAIFQAAIFYAGKSGDVELTMQALSDMNKWFTISLEEETFSALEKMNKNRLKPEQKREITRTAFEYMDRAKQATNTDLELQFAELALAAARGARDPKLVETAGREVLRIKNSQ